VKKKCTFWEELDFARKDYYMFEFEKFYLMQKAETALIELFGLANWNEMKKDFKED